MKRTLIAMTVSLLAATACGQEFGGGGQSQSGFGTGIITMLLMDPEVGAELKITDAQRKQLMDIGTGMQDEMGQVYQDAGGDPDQIKKAMQALLEKTRQKQLAVLSADQNKRLQEIYVQDNGVGAIVDEDVQKALGFKEAQTKKVASLQEGLTNATRLLGANLQSQAIDFQSFQDATAKNQKIMQTKLGEVLTADQKKKLKSMAGKPFKRKSHGK